ncbi:MAG: PQQ-binding-like beta-propeller repeat protein [Cyclobacteriaceae bacterium]|nr:PQQ-binding-like beta-propeller repeat protein [Cyclobacteriaceae bacterium]
MTRYKLMLLFVNSMIAGLLFSCTDKAGFIVESGNDWPVYLGGKNSAQYSPLKQINRENVHQLKSVWEFKTGDFEPNRTQIQCNPIIIDGILYGTSPKLKAFALNAATGELIWEYDPKANISNLGMNVNRGLAYWSSGKDRRILYTAGSNLICLNADNGVPVESFGHRGIASLKAGLGRRSEDLYVVSTSPGIVFKDLLIIGTRVSENADAAPGYIRAYNIKTGKVAWVFYTIPRPGEYGYDTWPKYAYKNSGGVNAWAGLSLDEKRGIVFVPTGSASFDFWGGDRLGKNLFANCIIALDAKTGKRIWHYQTVRHDLWDRDLPAPPNLVTIEHEGKMVDAIAQITKSGFVFLFERTTGKPLFPIEEIEVPASDLEGEEAWPTQPIPVKPPPFARQKFTMEEVTDISQSAHDYVAGILSNVRTGNRFIPPSTQGTVIFPGFDGGGEWGGAAFDPDNKWLYVNANEMPWILTMVKTQAEKGEKLNPGASLYLANCAMCHGPDRKGDPTGTYPSLLGVEKKYSYLQLMEILNNGRGFMPGYQQFSEEKKEALINFISDAEHGTTDEHSTGIESNLKALPYTHTGYYRFFDPEGYPAVKPPWGTLSAIDIGKGEIVWQVPLGEFKELTERGIPKTGTENYGGPVVTAGGLIFIGATKDEYFRVFDKLTGDELWKYKLPAGGYATPAVYAIDGKQYVVIAAGGGKMGTKSGDSYIAFAL